MSKKIISLFSGAGGFDIGMEKAGFETAVLVEKDSSCCETLRFNFPNTPVIEGDICKISTMNMLKTAGLKPLEPALVIGGPPCQSFSLAGKRLGMNDERGMLVLEFVRVVREALPTGFIMENVKGMKNWDGGRAINAIIDELKDPVVYKGKEYSYNVSVKVLNAADYGAPQFRERVILVGNRIDKQFEFPKPTHGLKNINLLNGSDIKPYSTVMDAIGSLPEADEPSETAKRISETIKERIVNHGY
ncbi:DNA cytosine methyltransferase [Aquimarina sp. MAR_2010_214]|uniref:DNA cytosine methyltransferase n=1 Tax=Aquimarina sp. MAR_2010_214 TaxID=1250026 RepID=UPI000C6FFD52|nr:DNA (cytosine-5-)-methyltransferase [Aquimarina sp. MAR_2010_214]